MPEELHAPAFDGDAGGPALVTSPAPVEPAAWGRAQRDALDALLERRRAVLLRGLGIDTVERFQALLGALGAELIEYAERSTPRSTVAGRVYTSTEYPSSDEIPLHNENSYSGAWPRRVFFCCLRPADEGGATPIADGRRVYAALDADVRRRFLERQVMYVRNYGQGVDLSWQEAFQTAERGAVEAYCRAARIEFEWFAGGQGLRTRQVRPAALVYRPTGERVWFNQAHLFHVSSLAPRLREALCAVFAPDRLPRHACYGDGAAIEDEALDHVRATYARLRTLVEWRRGDVLLLDNIFYAHGRLPYAGQRRVVVAMAAAGGAETSPAPAA